MAVDNLQGKLTTFCQNVFLSKHNLHFSSIEKIEVGWECEIFSLTVHYIEHGLPKEEEWILKIYPTQEGVKKSSREFQNMQRMELTNFPLPKVFLLSTEDSPFGKPFILMGKIKGKLLGPLLAQSDRKDIQRLIGKFCEKLVHLHAIDWRPLVTDFGRYATVNRAEFITQEIVKKQISFHYADICLLDPICDWLIKYVPKVEWGAFSIVHKDYHPWNIIVTQDENICVLDWGDAGISDFRFDLGKTFMLMDIFMQPSLHHIVVTEYERIANQKTKQLEFFETWSALTYLFDVIQILRHGASGVGKQPAANRMLQQDTECKNRIYAFLCARTGFTLPRLEALLKTLP